ncbi:MAG: TolC family protein [Neisseria sp.]|nr:TolC family protein [Neisseria sp.]
MQAAYAASSAADSSAASEPASNIAAPPAISEEAAAQAVTAAPPAADAPTFRRVITSDQLQLILQQSLLNDPRIAEAWANDQAAQERADASFALHYPTVAVQGNRLLSQDHKYPSDEKSTRFNPGVTAKLNLFSWGAINNQVKRDKEKERYFYYKYYETREELGNEIATQYLDALFYREALVALRDSLARHEKILHDLNIIVENDQGRRSEWVQAKAREVQVRQSIATYETNLATALSRLEKYTGRAMKAERLQDPFPHNDPQQIIFYTRDDHVLHPTYMAQKAELQSVRSEFKASKGRQLPSVNIEATANRDSREVYFNVSWDLFNRATSHTVAANAQELVAAEERLTQVYRDIDERTRTAKSKMAQSRERIDISEEQVQSNRDVVHAYELQFKIARKTLIELLNAYNDLASVELAAVNARHDFRSAALSYLHAQNEIATWAGVAENPRDKRYLQETASHKPIVNDGDAPERITEQTEARP